MRIKVKQNKMKIIKGHKFYDIWGRSDLLFVEGVEGSGIFEQLSFNFWVQNYLFYYFFVVFLKLFLRWKKN